MIRFSGLNSTAHTLVCLRINPAVTGETARLTADLPGSALIGRDLHPLDDFSEFHKVIVTSLLSDQQSLVATGNTFGRGIRAGFLARRASEGDFDFLGCLPSPSLARFEVARFPRKVGASSLVTRLRLPRNKYGEEQTKLSVRGAGSAQRPLPTTGE